MTPNRLLLPLPVCAALLGALQMSAPARFASAPADPVDAPLN